MKRAMFISRNLIGDGLNISPALRAWYADHQDWEIDLLTNPDQIAPLYERMGVPLHLVYAQNDKAYGIYDFAFDFDCGKAFSIGEMTGKHITACYAMMLGVDISKERKPTYEPFEEDHEKDLVLVSVFSKSCSSREGLPPNKMLPWDKVSRILPLLRQAGRIGVLGAEGDQVPIFKDSGCNVVENEYYLGLPLNKVALMLRDCKMLFTIDNGVSHLAASQNTRSVVLYPACLDPRWIAPIGNENAVIVHADPKSVPVAALLRMIREQMSRWNVL